MDWYISLSLDKSGKYVFHRYIKVYFIRQNFVKYFAQKEVIFTKSRMKDGLMQKARTSNSQKAVSKQIMVFIEVSAYADCSP